MKKTTILKSLFLLCILLAGGVSVSAENEWVPADLSELNTNDVVLLVDKDKGIALGNDLKGNEVTISDNKIADGVSANIQWTLTKNDDNTVTFKNGNNPLSVKNDFTLTVGQGTRSDFTYNTGWLGIDFGSSIGRYCIKWKADNSAVFENINNTANGNTYANFTFYKIVEKQIVKWKMVNGTDVESGDVVVIVDQNTGLAMSNDKDDKNPDAVAVKLNYDKDRILGDVDEKIQWTLEKTDNTHFKFAAEETKNLYADSKGLKVGTGSSDVFEFATYEDVEYMRIAIDGTTYIAGVEESMFSNSWKLVKETNEGKPDDKVKDTRIAIFKKVENGQTIPEISFPSENYEINSISLSPRYFNAQYEKAECNLDEDIFHYSSNTDIAVVTDGVTLNQTPNGNYLVIMKRGTIQLIARVEETAEHDKAVTVCTVRINDTETDKGTKDNPLTPSEAIRLAKGETVDGVTFDPDRSYFILGKVNKVNSGMMAMFGDLGLDEMMGDDMDMDERMGDMDDFDMSEMGDMMGGMDFASMIPGFGNSDGLTYFISDDGTKDNRLKVVNGRGMVTLTPGNPDYFTRATFEELKDLSPGDDVLVYGPLEVSEDKNLFASLMGNTGTGTGEETEDKRTVKVGELNYLHDLSRTLIVKDSHLYTAYEKKLPNDKDFFYTINSAPLIPITGEPQLGQIKSADEEIAKWIVDEAKTDSVFTAINPGTTKITVKVKVIVSPAEGDNKEKSYTMKRKFNLEVRPRDKEPEGKNVGEYVLIMEGDEIPDNTRLLIVGTRTKEGADDTHYVLSENSSTMGGGKGGNKIDSGKITTNDDGRERILYEDVPSGSLEIILEKADDEGHWYLNVGKDENGDELYLYASDTSEETTGDEGDDNKFDFSKIMEMFNPSSGMKVGTKAGTANTVAGVDSLKATISFSNDIATIKYVATEGKNNTIVLCSSFDMDAMMEMFGGLGGSENGDDNPDDDPTEDENTFDMGSFDMFMASFNTKKKAADDKNFLPRIFGFVQYDEYPITIGNAEWITIVSDFDVTPPDGVDAYVVEKVLPAEAESKAILKKVESLKGGEPYLLHGPSEDYKMTRTADVTKPELNLLLVSDDETTGEKGNTSVYVLANKSKGVGFYKWTGGKLGTGRVYLPVDATVEGANEFCSFLEESTAIQAIDGSTLLDGPYYDLQGRRVQKLTKGVYIVNGQKIVIK